ncbi:MAG: (2Fe-2S)-binding protein [Leptospiraceae bacterium]|nr:(2Fe-2S)-binding protein [Leptospiraceae bacterium]
MNDKAIRRCVEEGARSVEDLERDLGVGSSCGRCRVHAEAVIHDQLKPAGPGESPVPFSSHSRAAM